MIEQSPENVSEDTARTLRVIVGAMAGGLTMMAGLVAWSHMGAAAKGTVPTPQQLKTVNTLTMIAMAVATASIAASEILWRTLLKSSKGPFAARVQSAFIVRMACREGAGLLGMTVAYIAALGGVLHAYPAYWVNGVPYVLFLLFVATHWPTAERLTAQARDVAGSGPVLPQ